MKKLDKQYVYMCIYIKIFIYIFVLNLSCGLSVWNLHVLMLG